MRFPTSCLRKSATPASRSAMDASPEHVYTMTEYYDGPRGGVADFRGTPHVYRSLWTDVGNTDP